MEFWDPEDWRKNWKWNTHSHPEYQKWDGRIKRNRRVDGKDGVQEAFRLLFERVIPDSGNIDQILGRVLIDEAIRKWKKESVPASKKYPEMREQHNTDLYSPVPGRDDPRRVPGELYA